MTRILFLFLFVPLAVAGQVSNPAGTLKDSQLVVKETFAVDARVPRSVLDASLCVAVFPWTHFKAVLADSTFAFRIVLAEGNGVITCRTGNGFRGTWSQPVISKITAKGSNKNEWGGRTDVILLILSRRAADKLASGNFDLSAAKITSGVPSADAFAKMSSLPDIAAFSFPWIDRTPLGSKRDWKAETFGGVTFETAPLIEVDAKAVGALYQREAAVPDVLKTAGGASTTPPDEFARFVETRSPATVCKVSLAGPTASIKEANVTIKASATGCRAIEKIDAGGAPATVTPNAAGVDFQAQVSLPLTGKNVISGTLTETSGVVEPFQFEIERQAPISKPAVKPGAPVKTPAPKRRPR